MAKITRKLMKIFGSSSGLDEIEQFGSLAAGTPVYTTDPETIQALANYLEGWFGGVVGNNVPAIEDMNALCYLFAYQLAYILQEGIAEWNASTTYYIGSIVNSSGKLYVSLTDTNLNHAVSDTANWHPMALFVSGSSGSPSSVGGSTAVTVSGSQDQDIYVKGNGGGWVARSDSNHNEWHSVCWSEKQAQFVAVAVDLGVGSLVMTSPDGITWTSHGAAEDNQWYSVCYSQELNLFCAVAIDGTHRVMTSSDGASWSAQTAAEANRWSCVIWSRKLGLFIAGSQDSGDGKHIMTSPDGTTWTARTSSATDLTGICYSEELGLLVTVSSTGTNRIMYSPDGITWTAIAAPEANSWNSVTWSPAFRMFVAVASTGTHRVMYSFDGSYWLTATAAAAKTWSSVTWSPELAMFFAVSQDGFSMCSPDGINWTSVSVPEANQWNSIVWAKGLKMFAAVSFNGTHRAMSLAVTPITANPQITAGSAADQRLRLIGTDYASPLVLSTGTGIYLRKDVYLNKDSVLDMFWDVDQSLWVGVAP